MRTKQKSSMMLATLVLLLGLVANATAGWITSGNNMYADVPGNVGIGTGAPMDMFHILDGADWASMLLGRSEGGGFVGFNAFFSDGNWKRVNAWNDGAFIRANVSTDDPSTQLQIGFVDHLDDSNSQVMVVRKDGNVGIGTMSPDAKLDVISSTDYCVRGQAYSTEDVEIYGGHFTAEGWSGIGVYGQASYTGDEDETGGSHYGGYFVGEAPHPLFPGGLQGGIGIYAKGGLWAGDFDGDVRIKGDIALIDGEVRGAKGFTVVGGMIESTSIHGSEEAIGVHGLSDKGKGVSGYSNTGKGVYGYSREGNGVRGSSPDGYAGAFMGKVRITDMPTIVFGHTVKWEGQALGQKGELGIGVSSARFKENIEPLADDFHKILKTEPKSFTPKGSSVKGIGFIAEDFDELGLSHLLIYQDGRPLSIRYELISVYLLEILKEQVETNRRLEAEIELLKLRLDTLDQQTEQ